MPDIGTTTANPARVWDYWLGGKDHFAADREAAEQMLQLYPPIRPIARADRQFLRRAVRYAAETRGIRQFVDLGCGLPTAANTHDVAQAIAPESRIVYVDHDRVVLSHARALLTSTPEGTCRYIDADITYPELLLPELHGSLDFTQPVAVMGLSVWHFVPDDDQLRAILRAYMAPLPAGSALIIAHGTAQPDSPEADAQTAWNKTVAAQLNLRTPEQLQRLLTDWTLAEPGLVPAIDWRPDREAPPSDQAAKALFGAVAVKD